MDEVPFHVYAMKEPDYVMSLMSTYGTNLRSGKETCHEWVDSDGTKKTTKFNYPEAVGNHFLYRHSVDDHNNKRHSPISLEVVWGTKYWPNCVFSFLLAVTEVNVNLAAQYFGGMKQVGQIKFRKLLAKTLIFNSYYDDETDNTPEKKWKQCDSGHCLITLPKGGKFWERKSSWQTANIHNTSATHAAKGYIPIACALQGSISVQNVSVTILHAPKTILQHRAEFSRSETQKNDMPMTISSSRPKNI